MAWQTSSIRHRRKYYFTHFTYSEDQNIVMNIVMKITDSNPVDTSNGIRSSNQGENRCLLG